MCILTVGRQVALTVHGDGFVSEVCVGSLRWFYMQLRRHFENETDVVGADKGLAKDLKVLKRTIHGVADGIR